MLDNEIDLNRIAEIVNLDVEKIRNTIRQSGDENEEEQ